ncbi:SIN3 transcription regulator family member A [Brevipalpus obovatus]|uniref:SIN3 transcription regulator family member A n=1 Tax=Brevipalpus obovatus TaxID=246614 RepID=UPI003D9F474C
MEHPVSTVSAVPPPPAPPLPPPPTSLAAASVSLHSPSASVSLQRSVSETLHSPSSSPANQQGQFQRLKVEDALSYLDKVKFKFNNQPQVYNDFLDIMKEFKSQSIDTPGVIQRVSTLFRGHPELIVGFNTFLPPGYKIEMQSNDQVNVSMPSSTSILIIQNNSSMVTTNPAVIHPSQPLPIPPIPVSHHPTLQMGSNSSQLGSLKPLSSSSQPFSLTPATARSITPADSHHHPLSRGAVIHLATGTPMPESPVNLSTNTTTSIIPFSAEHVGQLSGLRQETGADHSNSSGPGDGNAGAQPVEFNHAINYVNKIKNRFQGQPEVYKQFLEILHAYQKEQKSLKEGARTESKPLNESHVYAQVASLFKDQTDLLQEFGQFLPDATNATSASSTSVVFPGSSDSMNLGVHHSLSHGSTTGSMISTTISAANHVENLAAANRAATNDHAIIVKKPLARPDIGPGSGGLISGFNSTSALQVKRPPTGLQSSSLKKEKATSLRDVSLAEAGKYGSLNEYAFFDKVRNALRIREVYENFLRCLFLYNHEIVSRNELVLLVTPFLGKFPELLKYFKDFLGYKEGNSNTASFSSFSMSSSHPNIFSDTFPTRPVGLRERERERINSEVTGMEIDYASCKRYGASYRALPKNYIQSECSGRTPLCREVLNDTWVSFPSWSEDSTFVTSKKTQYEEFIYRCEDERFELDVVIETNLSTIRVLEAVQKRLNRMTPEERSRFKLDECLGGTSAIIHQRSIRRIYGDKASEIIEGLKKNPSVAVPLVLRRLKAKEEEWKEAQKQFNKVWREQSEKYYLKSLDHQGISFKQNDIKYLRSKSLLNEIETFYEERHEQNEENMAAAGEGTGDNNNGGQNVVTGPHMTLIYKNRAMIEEACNLIIHHVKRQTSIHKEDKQKIKQLLKHFVPDLFSTPRGELSDDEIEDFEIDSGKRGSSGDENGKVRGDQTTCFPVNMNDIERKENKKNSNNNTEAAASSSSSSHAPDACKLNKIDNSSSEHVNGDDPERLKDIPVTPMPNVDPDDSYVLFVVNNYWYLFFRLHQILCERLGQMYERAKILIAEEEKEKKLRKESTAAALRLKPKNDYEVEEYFPALIDMVKQVLDGNLDFNQFEDQLREMFGIHAYIAFTLDKVVQNIVRQLQHIVCDETCIQCTEMFIEEAKNSATGGPCSTHHLRAAAEAAYQKRAEQLLSDEICFKIIICKGEGKVTIELIVTDSAESEDGEGGEVDKWSEYVEKFISQQENDISEELKERFGRCPLFLPRNIRLCRHKAKEKEEIEKEKEEKSLQISDDTQCKFNVNSYKMVFVVQSESYMCKTNALAKARKTHKAVSRRLHRKFNRFHQEWLDKNTTREQKLNCEYWMLGHTLNSQEEDERGGPEKENEDVEMKDDPEGTSKEDSKISSTCTPINSSESSSNSEIKLTLDPARTKTQRIVIDKPDEAPYRTFCKYLPHPACT